MNGPTLDQVRAWARHVGMAGMITDVVTTMDELERFAALAFAAGQAAEREARIAAQQELAECREAMTRAEHKAQRARGDIAAAVAAEREAMKPAIIAACKAHTREMEGYSYFGSNPGVHEDDYEDVANDAAAIRARGQQ